MFSQVPKCKERERRLKQHGKNNHREFSKTDQISKIKTLKDQQGQRKADFPED